MKQLSRLSVSAFAAAELLCGPTFAGTTAPAPVSEERLLHASDNTSDWLTTGRTYDEQRFSPLQQINVQNVGQLGLAWFADLDTSRGQEATPLLVDGNLYLSTAWSMVKAYDARTGTLLWSFDPKVPRRTLVKACCDAVNRGVAAWGEQVFVGTLDGRLISLDRNTGKQTWSVLTVDPTRPYTITGAPRVVKGKVIIGNAGAEFGVRGYVSAYGVRTGKLLWRFYTVPGNPWNSRDPQYLKAAAKTWRGKWWQLGGGGTVWDSMAYDPKLDLLYIGVGNGSPWNQAYRSPGGGDNLYLSSIVALRPDKGTYVWHYQTTPGETWDYTATQHLILADLDAAGRRRQVIMQAPKNGYFYVIDRATGELLSAKAYAPMNWSVGLDAKSGRPIENPAARYDKTGLPFSVRPGATGAHGWQPMSYSPLTRLVYIPIQDASFPYSPEANWRPAKMGYNIGNNLAEGAMPANQSVRDAALRSTTGALIAWDPIRQVEVWRAQFDRPSNGGVLSTGGNLVFQGTSAGYFSAYDARNGTKLWTTDVHTGVLAAPITYSLDGHQYVAVVVGSGGIWGVAPGILADRLPNQSRLLVFELGGRASLPAAPPRHLLPLKEVPTSASAQEQRQGAYLFGRFCSACHGDAAVGGTIVPDLRRSPVLQDANAWHKVVIEGILAGGGMVSFASALTPQQAESIRSYVIKRSAEDRELEARSAQAGDGDR